jgi:hypothetical protein
MANEPTNLMKVDALLNLLTVEQLNLVSQAARQRAFVKASNELRVGDTVSFNANKRGTKTGTLIRKNPKTYQVLVGMTTWRVTPTLLKKVA